MGSAIMAAVMMKLNTRPRVLATTALLTLLVALLTTFTLGYIPDQGEEITITGGEPAVSRGQPSQPW